MKVRSLLVSMLCMLALSVSFASCSDDDDLLDDSGSTVALPQVRAFFPECRYAKALTTQILLFMLLMEVLILSVIFFRNKIRLSLGDLGQTMIEYMNVCM